MHGISGGRHNHDDVPVLQLRIQRHSGEQPAPNHTGGGAGSGEPGCFPEPAVTLDFSALIGCPVLSTSHRQL